MKNRRAALDNTLSVLIQWSPVKYKVRYKGMIIECETREDATRLVDKIQAENGATQWSDPLFLEFTSRIGKVQKRLLDMLLSSFPDSVSDQEFRTVLTLPDNRALAGTLSGITKQALALDMESYDVYKSEVSYQSGKARRKYMIALGFRQKAQEMEWPLEEDLK